MPSTTSSRPAGRVSGGTSASLTGTIIINFLHRQPLAPLLQYYDTTTAISHPPSTTAQPFPVPVLNQSSPVQAVPLLFHPSNPVPASSVRQPKGELQSALHCPDLPAPGTLAPIPPIRPRGPATPESTAASVVCPVQQQHHRQSEVKSGNELKSGQSINQFLIKELELRRNRRGEEEEEQYLQREQSPILTWKGKQRLDPNQNQLSPTTAVAFASSAPPGSLSDKSSFSSRYILQYIHSYTLLSIISRVITILLGTTTDQRGLTSDDQGLAPNRRATPPKGRRYPTVVLWCYTAVPTGAAGPRPRLHLHLHLTSHILSISIQPPSLFTRPVPPPGQSGHPSPEPPQLLYANTLDPFDRPRQIGC